MNKLILFLLFTWFSGFAQKEATNEMSYNEFLGFVKKYHPLVKSANLRNSEAQANLMQARGGFDPKIEVDYSKKQFKDKEYYSILNSSFKIPTWYGIDLKASFDNADGIYLNPQNTLPNQGLYALGINVPLGQGLIINQRMADLRKAKIQMQWSESERKLQAILVLHDASVAYFNWKKNYEEFQLYQNYLVNAKTRFKAIQTLIQQGDKPAIDSIEAGIVVNNRLLSLEDSTLKLTKSKLELSNFLWLENNIPLELSDAMVPESKLELSIQETLKTNELLQQEFTIDTHPKINALQNKIAILEIDRKLKSNLILPKIDIGYSYLSEKSALDSSRFQDYKIGLNFYFPLFLRKERGGLNLAKYKVQDAKWTLDIEKVQLSNKIISQKTEIQSLKNQIKITIDLVKANEMMLKSEERLFFLGESALFIINTRENNLVSAQLARIAIENRFYMSNSELFKIIANPD